jgi:hypothetical protein
MLSEAKHRWLAVGHRDRDSRLSAQGLTRASTEFTQVHNRRGAMASKQARAPRRLQQLIRIDIDGDGDVFGKGQFVDGFADEAAQAHDGFAADQNVKSELSL